MSVPAKGQPAAIVPATTQTPKAIIPAEIKNESTVSMRGPLSSERKNFPAVGGGLAHPIVRPTLIVERVVRVTP
jgi:hypothetical protein